MKQLFVLYFVNLRWNYSNFYVGTRKLDPVFAFTVGKFKVEGDLGNALEIQKLIKNNISKQKAGKPPAFSAIFDKLF